MKWQVALQHPSDCLPLELVPEITSVSCVLPDAGWIRIGAGSTEAPAKQQPGRRLSWNRERPNRTWEC